MNDLPQGWLGVPLSEVTSKIGSGATPKGGHAAYAASGTPLIRSQNVHFSGFSDVGLAYLDEAQAQKLDGVTVRENDVLLNITGASIGRVTFAPERMEGARVNQHVAIIRPMAGIEPVFLTKYLASPPMQQLIVAENYGVTRQALTKAMIEDIELPVPPLPEQRRIVAKIDSLTGKSKRARDHLDHIPRLVEKYKQAVLAAAFRGQLLGLSTTETDHLHERCWALPKSWRWVRFSDVVDVASNLVKPETIPDLPHIAPDNVEGGTGRLLPFRTIREDGVISAKHRFFAGQVVYSKIRPYLRKAVLPDFDGACSADMYPLTTSDVLDAKYLLFWLISEQFANFTVEHEGRTVLPKINQRGLGQTPLPLPPLADQSETVRCLQTAFHWIDRLTSEATSASNLIAHLDQTLLSKAFRGELVPQNPTDEPASVLLERIKAKRGKALTAKRGRKAKAV